jgi:hypothetical protein
VSLLDVGYGPGTITVELAARVAPGTVLGADHERVVITEAGRLCPDSTSANVKFTTGDGCSARVGSWPCTTAITAASPGHHPIGCLTAGWTSTTTCVAGTVPTPTLVGPCPAWVRATGFTEIEVSSSSWTFAAARDRAWWGELRADRVLESSFAEQAVAYGLSARGTVVDLEILAAVS